MPNRRGLWLLALTAAAFGCDPGTVSVTVELRTDFVPGVEFVAVEAFADDRPDARDDVAVFRTDDYASAPRRVAEIGGLAPSASRRVTVRLLDADRAEVARRTVVIDHARDRGVIVLVTRRCRDVVCGPGESCFAGRCQPEACDGDACTAECASAADCAASECATATCITGACFAQPVEEACASGLYCDPELGCLVEPGEPADAGAPLGDAGFDAGVDAAVDAGVDAGPPFTLLRLAGASWAEQPTSGAIPAGPVRAAFASGDTEVIAITDDAVQVLDVRTWRWLEPRTRDATFPELGGVSIWEASEVVGTDVLTVYAREGAWEYTWDAARRAATFAQFTARADFGADWSDPEAAPWWAVHGLFSRPDDTDGWVGVDPSDECPGHTSVGRYVATLSTDGFGPAVMMVSIYDIDCPFRFVDQRPYGAFPPFMRAGAPTDPFAIEAAVYVDGGLLIFR